MRLTISPCLALVVAILLTAAIADDCPLLQACCEKECRNRYRGVVSNQCACAYGCIYSYHESTSGGQNTLCDARSDDAGECHIGARGAYCEGFVGSKCSKCNAFDPWVDRLGDKCEDIVCDVDMTESKAYLDKTGGDALDCQCECETPCQTGTRLQAKCKSHIDTEASTRFTETSRFYDKVYVTHGKMLGVCGTDIHFGGASIRALVDSTILESKTDKVDAYMKSSKDNADLCKFVTSHATEGYDSLVPGLASSSNVQQALGLLDKVNKGIDGLHSSVLTNWIFDSPVGKVVDKVEDGVDWIKKAASTGETVLKWGINTGLAAFGFPEACSDHAAVHAYWMQDAAQQLFSSVVAGSGGALFPKQSDDESSAYNEGCISYPQGAKICTELGHSHRVASFLDNDDVVSQRTNAIEIAWKRLMKSDAMKLLSDSHIVCKWSLKDAFCIEAFPPCDSTHLSTCQIICRNSVGCFEEAFPIVKQDLKAHRKQDHLMERCHEICSKAAKKNMGTDRLWSDAPMLASVHAAPFLPVVLFLFGLLGIFMAWTFARRAHGACDPTLKEVPTEDNDHENLMLYPNEDDDEDGYGNE